MIARSLDSGCLDSGSLGSDSLDSGSLDPSPMTIVCSSSGLGRVCPGSVTIDCLTSWERLGEGGLDRDKRVHFARERDGEESIHRGPLFSRPHPIQPAIAPAESRVFGWHQLKVFDRFFLWGVCRPMHV